MRVVCKGAPEGVLTADLVADSPDVITRPRAGGRLRRDGYRVLAVATRTGRAPDGAAPWNAGLRRPDCARRPTPAGRGDDHRRLPGSRHRAGAHHRRPSRDRSEHRLKGRHRRGRPGSSCPGTGGVRSPDPAGASSPAPPRSRSSTLVPARQRRRHVVAMTATASTTASAAPADIGVAMGGRGTEVARQAADMVLTDDDLGTVVAAVEEGRRVYANIRRFLLYGLAGGAPRSGHALRTAVGLALPLLPAQILWVNLMTHGLPGVAMGANRSSRAHAPPARLRPRASSVRAVAADRPRQRDHRAVTIGVACGQATRRPWQTLAFFALGATQLAVAIGSRARPGTRANPCCSWPWRARSGFSSRRSTCRSSTTCSKPGR